MRAEKIHLHRLYAQCFNVVGLHLARAGKSSQALRELKKAAKLVPDEFQFHASLGSLYHHQGDGRSRLERLSRHGGAGG